MWTRPHLLFSHQALRHIRQQQLSTSVYFAKKRGLGGVTKLLGRGWVTGWQSEGWWSGHRWWRSSRREKRRRVSHLDSERPPLEGRRACGDTRFIFPPETNENGDGRWCNHERRSNQPNAAIFFFFFMTEENQSMSERTQRLPRILAVDKEPSLNPYQTMLRFRLSTLLCLLLYNLFFQLV